MSAPLTLRSDALSVIACLNLILSFLGRLLLLTMWGRNMATKRQKKKAAKKRDMILEIFEKENVSKDIKDEIAELIKCKQSLAWSGYAFTPPGSLFEEIVKRFEKDTDLDLALPFFISLSMLATILIKRNIKIEISGRETEPTIWLQLLCDSGSGKTFCLNEIKKSIGHALDQKGIKLDNKEKFEDSLLWEPNAVSTAQFMHEWAGRVDKDGNTIEIEHNRRLMLVDEASDFFEQLKNKKGLLYPMYRNILAAYSHEKIEYATASNGKITVEKPVVNFLGLATPERFIEGISQNDIEGGFYYRFAMLISAEQRSMEGHAIYPFGILDGVEEKWKEILASIVHQTYVVSDSAIKYFCEKFDEEARNNSNMPRAYIRRMSWLTHKIAFVYHLVLGYGSCKEIGVESYRWAERLIAAFQNTAAEIIHRKMNTESVQTIQDVQRLINRRKEKGLETTPRDIVLGTKIATKEAELYHRILNR